MSPVYIGLIRHLLTAAGGALVASGAAVDEGMVAEVAGALSVLIGAVWSALAKRPAA